MEKATVPKRVKTSSTTAVGIRWLVEREIEETIRAEAEKVGAEIMSVEVNRDPQHGLRALVKVSERADALREALDRYAFKAHVSAA